jgi:ribosomal protein L37E
MVPPLPSCQQDEAAGRLEVGPEHLMAVAGVQATAPVGKRGPVRVVLRCKVEGRASWTVKDERCVDVCCKLKRRPRQVHLGLSVRATLERLVCTRRMAGTQHPAVQRERLGRQFADLEVCMRGLT